MTRFFSTWWIFSATFTTITFLMEPFQVGRCDCRRNRNRVKTDIARELYKRMFPKKELVTMGVLKPKLMVNSTCFYVLTDGECWVTSNSKSALILRDADYSRRYAGRRSQSLCSQIPYKPAHSQSDFKTLKIVYTNVASVKADSFASWSVIESLKISNNELLKRIDPGAFNGLTHLWDLEITDNPSLSSLHRDSLKGLVRLRKLAFIRNNLTHVKDISEALSPKHLPYLLNLDLTGNKILRIGENDFLPMKGGVLYALLIGRSQTEYIHPRAFDPFGESLKTVAIFNVNFNRSNVMELIQRTLRVNTNIRYISLDQNLFCRFPKELLQSMSDRYLGITLGKNRFGSMKSGSIPHMRKLKYLDISDVLIDGIANGVVNSTVLPFLQHFYIGNNELTRLTKSMVTPTITKLVMNQDPGDLDVQQQICPFEIDDGVLESMPHLFFLDLSGNNLIRVNTDTFRDAKALRILLLRRTLLTRVDARSFENNARLYYLDLSHNQFPLTAKLRNTPLGEIFYGLDGLLALDLSFCDMDSLNGDLFTHLGSLQYVSLRGNPVIKLGPDTFRSLPSLNVVDLRNSILTSWGERVLTENQCLDRLLLSYNNILSITKAMLEDFTRVRDVNMFANSINCDCQLLHNVRDIVSEWNGSSFLSRTDCLYPDIQSLKEYVDGHETACVSYTDVVVACSVMAMAIAVLLLTVVYYKYKYDIQYRYLLLKKRLGIVNTYRARKRFSDPGYFRYDAFVSYSAQDSGFVEKMRMILEKDGSRFRLCVFERDFNPGDNLVDRILECMEASVVTILVLTDAFASSEWCRWEMSIAQNKAVSQRFLKDSVIVVLKSRVEESLMTPTLKYLMDTRVYLEWHEHSSVRQNIFWEKLKDALKLHTQIKLPRPEITTDRSNAVRTPSSH